MRELQQQDLVVLPAAEKGQVAFGLAGHQFHAEADFGGPAYLQVNTGLVEAADELLVGGLDAGRSVVVASGVDVRGADQMADAVLHGDAGQLQGGFQVGCAVVDAGEQVVMQVDHWVLLPLCCRVATGGSLFS
ncbi:hypothetical protein D3C81_1752340 [compost metagenome]